MEELDVLLIRPPSSFNMMTINPLAQPFYFFSWRSGPSTRPSTMPTSMHIILYLSLILRTALP
jgi:hypothetical protein